MAPKSRITKSPIDPSKLMRSVFDKSAGGVAVFVGTVRNANNGRAVTALAYEAYRAMAEKKMLEIEKAAKSKWPIKKIAAVHRYGRLRVGEVSVAVAVSCEHRGDAFDACRYVIDEIKRTVPLWKKERGPGGTESWIGSP